MMGVEALDVRSDLGGPGGWGIDLVAGFPPENRHVVAIELARQRVAAVEDISNRLLEVVDELPVGPKILLSFAAKGSVLGGAAHPTPIVNERYDDAHLLLVGSLEHLVERLERCLVEFTRAKDMDVIAHVGPLSAHGDDVTAN